jgi:hypothetical protein
MEMKPLEVFAEDSNFGIVRMPGRNYPGCVVQGDSLFNLWRAARRVAEAVRDGSADGEDFRDAVEELYDSLLERLLHYQQVLSREGLDLPNVRPVEATRVRSTDGEGGPP